METSQTNPTDTSAPAPLNQAPPLPPANLAPDATPATPTSPEESFAETSKISSPETSVASPTPPVPPIEPEVAPESVAPVPEPAQAVPSAVVGQPKKPRTFLWIIIIILILLIAGVVYYFGFYSRNSSTANEDVIIQNSSKEVNAADIADIPTTDTVVKKLELVSSGDEITDISQDLSSTSASLNDLDAELSFVVTEINGL